MIHVRRSTPEPRLEMTPLIDVVFLLLTFFLFSVVVMVRARVLDVELPAVGAAETGTEVRAVTIALRADGGLHLEGEAITAEALAPRLLELRSEVPDLRILIAADESGRSGSLLGLIDTLTNAGITDFGIIGQRDESP